MGRGSEQAVTEGQPVILVHSGVPGDDPVIAGHIRDSFPAVSVLTAGTEQEIVEHLPGADILFAWDFPIPLLGHARSLRWFQMMGAGIETLRDAPLGSDVVVTNVRGVFGGSMAEYVLTYVLAHLQDVAGVLDRQARHIWEPFTPRRLAGLTIGIVGLGSIGSEIARIVTALGTRVIGLSRSGKAVDGVERVYGVDAIEDFLPECDVLVTVAPQTPETVGLLSRDRLRLLKPSCFYVNIGRGTIVDLDDITEALRERRIAGAALDVFPTEPLPSDHLLWTLDNVFITPHISGINRPDDVTGIFLENLDRYLTGQPLLHQVNLSRGY